MKNIAAHIKALFTYLFLQKVAYRYVLPNDLFFDLPKTITKDYDFADKNSKVWLQLKKTGVGIVKKGYACDGCSPKIKIPIINKVVGTWDGKTNPETNLPVTAPAFFAHDACYQFLDDKNMPLTRKEMDDVFKVLILKSNFPKPLAYIYTHAVKMLGGIYHAIAS